MLIILLGTRNRTPQYLKYEFIKMKNLIFAAKFPLINNFLLNLSKYNRFKIHNLFLENTVYDNSCSVLDVGTTADTHESNNILLQNTRNNKNISCLSDQDLGILKKKFPHVKNFYLGDGKKTNFPENSFDIIFSSAVIEHVGTFKDQIDFIKECIRIGKHQVFITTPNRYYPIDFHTRIPFLHWLPKKIHRFILKIIGFKFYSLEKNLNLLDRKTIIKIMESLNIQNYTILNHKFLYATSNLILIIKL